MTRASILLGLIGSVLFASGCQTSRLGNGYEPIIAQFFLETPAQAPHAVTMKLPESGTEIPVAPQVVFSEGDVANVELVHVDLGLCLLFQFTPDAARSLTRVSAGNLGRRLVVTLNGRPFGARVLDGPIIDGNLLIFVELTDEELTKTAVNLKRTAADIQAAVARGRH